MVINHEHLRLLCLVIGARRHHGTESHVMMQETGRANMNASGDDHVSFTASHLSLSPCGKYLLVSSDGARIIMYRVAGL
jgi:hypothetical protein